MPTTLDYARRTEFDTGRFVARYLQVLAWLSVVSMLVSLLRGSLHINLSPVFLFWAAAGLKKHSPRARLWVIWLDVLMLVGAAALFLWIAVDGTAGTHLSLGPIRRDNPPLWLCALALVPFLIICAIPLVVLMSDR